MYEIDEVMEDLVKLMPMELWLMVRKYLFRYGVEVIERGLKKPELYYYTDSFVFCTFKYKLCRDFKYIIEKYSDGPTSIFGYWKGVLVVEEWCFGGVIRSNRRIGEIHNEEDFSRIFNN